MASQDFNSDDIDFGVAPPKNGFDRSHGQASIEKIIEDAGSDRLDSKRVVKQLAFGSGSPSYRFTQSLWVNRFEAFRTHTLKQDLDKPFTGDDMIRFFQSMIGKIVPKGNGKPAPNQTTVINAAKILIFYGHFKWTEEQGYKIFSNTSVGR